MFDDGFVDFMGYRNMVVEDKIEECVDAFRRGQTEICVDVGDLTQDEIGYVQKEVDRRLVLSRL